MSDRRSRIHAYAEAFADVAIEGSVDRFCGRPLDANPYCLENAATEWDAWDLGWRTADDLLDVRGAEEARRWLEAA
jgi:hypothetical protein